MLFVLQVYFSNLKRFADLHMRRYTQLTQRQLIREIVLWTNLISSFV